MSQKFLFEELDDATRKYLMAVREAKGHGTPGIFALSPTAFGGCSCAAGLVLIPLTLVATLTSWMDVVYKEPIAVAFLQTAGLVLGGWLLLAFFRAKGTHGNDRIAGSWVYLDALNLYEAYQETVTVTPIEDLVEANFTHHYNNGKYQHSSVRLVLAGRKVRTFSVNDELRAEQFVIYANYLAWARGEDGGEVGKLPPAQLGAVARHVARHDAEPRDAEGRLNLELVELAVPETPNEPTRVGRAAPSLLPYILMLVASVVVFVVMAFLVNPPVRDEALYEAVMQRPTEPQVLRAYLIDPRNTMHREEVLQELRSHYFNVIQFVKTSAQQPELRDGMVKILTGLSTEPNQPVASLRVIERSPPEIAAGAPARVNRLRQTFVGGDGAVGNNREGVLDVFARISPAVSPLPGMVFPQPPPPIGYQLIGFVEPPEGASAAHFLIVYELTPAAQKGQVELSATVEIREAIDGQPIAAHSEKLLTCNADEASLNVAVDRLRLQLVRWMAGSPDQQQAR
jgi:hypothetical protein